jgi:biotin-dependent carboxylase-like uncharacterized protein
LDKFATRTANLLVGNPEAAAVLEITFLGPRLEVLTELQAALTGAEAPILVNDKPQPTWTALSLRPGDVLAVKPPKDGLRGYLAVGGGIDVARVMGSRSTYAGAKLGGFQGRPLAKGDILSRGEPRAKAGPKSLPQELRPVLSREMDLRAVPGPQDDLFDQGLTAFFTSGFKVSSKADRMGYRLEGPLVELKKDAPRSIISEPSLAGAVQIPADGQPIILLVEQTVGGYAKIATVVTPDLDLVAQARPGDAVTFRRIDLQEAHQAVREAGERMERVRQALA